MKMGILLASLLVTAVVGANPTNSKEYYEIASLKVEEINNYVDFAAGKIDANEERLEVGKVVEKTEALIAVGKKIWAIVEHGRPVLDLNFSPSVSVLPNAKSDPLSTFYSMENWSTPRTKAYRVIYTNALGMDVIVFEYGLIYQYGGSLDDNGKYLTAVDIVPISVNVSFGYSFNATSELVGITNVGSKEDPIASARLRLHYVVSTMIKRIEKSVGFYVEGDGSFSRTH